MIDTDTFKLLANIDAGAAPRVVVQPDGKYLGSATTRESPTAAA